MKKFLCLSALLMASACSLSAAQTARTAGAGNFQVGLEPGAVVAMAGGETVVGPNLDIAVRVGVTDKIDLGGRIGSSALELQSKFQMTPDDGVIVSVAPRLSVFFFGIGGVQTRFIRVPVPVLIDVPVGESAFVFGPGVDVSYFGGSGGGASANAVLISGLASAGYAAKISDGFRIMPEVALALPFAGGASASGGGETEAAFGTGTGGVLTSFKLNFLLGKTK